jgi:hypothetical protein
MDIWTYREGAGGDTPLEGFDVEAADGGIGRVDSVSTEEGASYLVVDTGPWIFGKRILLPAGVVESVDADLGLVRVGCTKSQVRRAPEHALDAEVTDAYRGRLARHFAAPQPGT